MAVASLVFLISVSAFEIQSEPPNLPRNYQSLISATDWCEPDNIPVKDLIAIFGLDSKVSNFCPIRRFQVLEKDKVAVVGNFLAETRV